MRAPLHRIAAPLLLAIASFAQSTSSPALRVTVRDVIFDDTVGLPADVEHSVERTVAARTYDERYDSTIAEVVRDALQQHGFFKATVLDPVKFTTVSSNAGAKVVDAHVMVTPGEQYSLGSISFSGVTAFPSSQLRGLFPIADGALLDVQQIRRGIKGMKDLYCTKGYINFTPVPDFSFDESARQVAMKIDVDEGQPYRVGKLFVESEESVAGARKRLLDAWAKYEGTSDCNPVADLFRDLHARPNLPVDKMVQINRDNQNHTINYVLTLGKAEVVGVSERR